ncbi:MAG: diguanylate cyclase [Zoogloeaceae bacterium]|jgi:diguanylate cyclase (GGDEF)-like protein|nr:diguanylate cyclase [Zoogloeaceae bacterium]
MKQTKTQKTRTLFTALHQANLIGAVVSMIVAGVTLSILTLFTLWAQVNANLELVARTIAYSTEAALMFDDGVTAQEILAETLERENLEMAMVVSRSGKVLAHAEEEERERNGFDHFMNRLLFPGDTVIPVMNGGESLGKVAIRGDGAILRVFFLKMTGAILVCLILTGLSALWVTRKAERQITSQLDALAKNTFLRHTLRTQGETRLHISEFQQINTQFKALLAELDAKNAELLARQMRLEDVNASLNYQATHDDLTGLANRAYFNDCLERAIALARSGGGKLAVLYLDSDHFKSINDRHGHTVGDMYLVQTAQSIRQAVRHSDLVARLGGDEFAVLLSPIDSLANARRVARKILDTPDIVLTHEGRELPFTLRLSVGIAIFPKTGHDGESLILAADHAMYRAKKAGGHRYCEAAGNFPVEE